MTEPGVSPAARTDAPRQAMAGKWDIRRLGTLEAEISRMGEKSGRGRITSWDAAFAAGLTIACLLSYEVITVLLSEWVGRANEFLGGMWTVVATVFVFRNAGAGGLAAGMARFVATCVSILLCFLYLLIFPFTAIGMACLIGQASCFWHSSASGTTSSPQASPPPS